MIPKVFDELVDNVLKTIGDTLKAKGGEYSTETDRLHNFATGARMRGRSRAKTLDGMKLKHDVSILDLIEWNDTSPEKVTKELIEEKCKDAICYHILLWAILLEDLEK